MPLGEPLPAFSIGHFYIKIYQESGILCYQQRDKSYQQPDINSALLVVILYMIVAQMITGSLGVG